MVNMMQTPIITNIAPDRQAELESRYRIPDSLTVASQPRGNPTTQIGNMQAAEALSYNDFLSTIGNGLEMHPDELTADAQYVTRADLMQTMYTFYRRVVRPEYEQLCLSVNHNNKTTQNI